jgi:TonB family protein
MKFLLCKLTSIFAVVLLLANITLAQTESEKGIEFYRNGEYQKATESLQKAAEADKENQELWLYLGMSFARLQMKKEAAGALDKAYKLEKKDREIRENEVKITEKPRPSYTDAARSNQTQGTVAIAVEFGANGKINYAFLVRTLPNGLTENVMQALRKIKFNPATKDGKPVISIKIIQYSFTIY